MVINHGYKSQLQITLNIRRLCWQDEEPCSVRAKDFMSLCLHDGKLSENVVLGHRYFSNLLEYAHKLSHTFFENCMFGSFSRL